MGRLDLTLLSSLSSSVSLRRPESESRNFTSRFSTETLSETSFSLPRENSILRSDFVLDLSLPDSDVRLSLELLLESGLSKSRLPRESLLEVVLSLESLPAEDLEAGVLLDLLSQLGGEAGMVEPSLILADTLTASSSSAPFSISTSSGRLLDGLALTSSFSRLTLIRSSSQSSGKLTGELLPSGIFRSISFFLSRIFKNSFSKSEEL